MARILSIGFELNSLTANVEVTGTFTTSATIAVSSAQAHTGSFAALCTNTLSSSVTTLWRTLPSAGVYYARAYIYVTAYTSSNATLFELVSTATSQAVGGIYMNSSGQLGITTFNAGSPPTYNSTLTSALSQNTWHSIELKVDASVANTQVVTGRLDGIQIDSQTGLATLTANTINELDFGIGPESVEASSGTIYFDDIVVNDTTGSFQNTWAGEGSLLRYSPSAAGDSNTFATQTGGTAGAANNFTRVDEVQPDSATTFNGSNTLNQSDLYAVAAVGTTLPGGSTINCVSIGVWYRASVASAVAAYKVQVEKASAGTISQSAAITPNSTTFKANANAAPLTSPLTLYQDPDSTNWTTSTIGTMQIGMIISTGNTNRADISTIWAYVDYTAAASGLSVNVSDTVTTSENVPTPAVSYGVDVEPANSAYKIPSVKIVGP